MKNYFALATLVLVILVSACGGSGQTEKDKEPAELTEEELIQKAQEIHDRVITLDTHCDINTDNFTEDTNYTQNLETQVNLPKMEEGGLDVAWFIVYTGQGENNEEGFAAAYENAMDKFDAIHRLCEEIAPDRIGLATSSKEVKEIIESGRKVAMIGIENGYPIGIDIANVKKFFDLGGRYISLSHNRHSQLSDSHTGESDSVWLHNGVSDLGKEVIRESNKWGIMLDISHPSKESMRQTIELTEAPIIASHSSARALSDHSRNLDDEQLGWIKENGGVVQTVALGTYVHREKQSAHQERRQKLYEEIAKEMGFELLSRREAWQLEDEARESYITQYRELQEKAEPRMEEVNAEAPPVNVSDFVDHIDYMVNLIGIDHVGISSDFDGGGGIEGWSDASETFNVTLELVRRGYTEEEISKIWSGNLLRVLDEVQGKATEIQSRDTTGETD